MKLNANEQKEAVIIGDIETNKVGIDRNNVDFITTLLTTNLYSNPLGSFLRETIANGQDSQREAGVEHPLLLVINKELNSSDGHYTISIRDFGTGVSPERFDKIYRNIGSSTKRESNDYIGAFGIGRFSALAVADIVFINSYYEGTCYAYIMYKDGTSISIDKISETKGDFENGLEVKLDYEYRSYYHSIEGIIAEELKQLKYFPSLYVDNQLGGDNPKLKAFNDRQIKKFKHFTICNFGSNSLGCVVGNVRYPIESNYTSDLANIISDIDLLFDIGELDITPNREALRYSPKTVTAIQNKVSAVIKEIKEACKSQCFGNFENILSFLNYIQKSQIEVPIGNYSIILTKRFCLTHSIEIPIKIKGEALPNGFNHICNKLIEANWENYVAESDTIIYGVSNDRFYSKNFNSLKFINLIAKFEVGNLYHSNGRLSGISKKYFKENNIKDSYHTTFFLKSSALNKIKYNIFKRFKKVTENAYNSKELLKALIKFFYPIYKEFLTQYAFNNDSVPQSYRDANKATVVKNTTTKSNVSTGNVTIYTLTVSSKYSSIYRGYGPVAIANDDTFDNIKKYKGCVVYASKEDTAIDYIYYLWNRSKAFSSINTPNKIKFIKVAPSKLFYLKELDNAIYISDYIDSAPAYLRYICEMFSFNKKIIADKTLNNLSNFFGSTSTLLLFKPEINRLLIKAHLYIQDFKYDFNASAIETIINELTITYKNTNKLDLSVEQTLLENNKVLKLLQFIETYRCTKTDILVNFCLKQKLCIPSLQAYQQYKQSIYCN